MNNQKLIFTFIFLLSMLSSHASDNQLLSIQLEFYNEKINVGYNSEMVFHSDVYVHENAMVDYYNRLEKTKYQLLINDLEAHKNRLALNDWLYYELIRATVQKIYSDKKELQKTLTCWFLLTKSGYDTRLTYLRRNVFLYAYSKEDIFEIPMIEDDGKTFINLSTVHNKIDSKGFNLNMLSFSPNDNGQSFSFDLSQLPKLNPKKNNKVLHFNWNGSQQSVDVQFDKNLIDMMEHYPIFDELKYIKTPLSDVASKSLLPQLQKLIINKTEEEALQIIAAFTRSAFSYKDDKDHFGKNKPMIADELFYYAYSDCEDRSALFYFLVKELLNLPMIVIAYDDHISIGVASKMVIGDPIIYNGKRYYICDPTGPSNSFEVGYAPIGYRNKKFEILRM